MSEAPPMLPRGGARPVWRLRRPKRLAVYHDAGAKALAAEVIIQAVGEVREGIAAGWLNPDGSVISVSMEPYPWSQRLGIEHSRKYQRQQRRITARARVAEAAAFLRSPGRLRFWLQLAEWGETPAQFVAKFWWQMKREQTKL